MENLHNQELCDLYMSPSIVWAMNKKWRWVGPVARM